MSTQNTKPLSEAQIAANRNNAAKSTGPKTPAGKAASSRNALRHGLCAEKHVILDEDPEEFQALLDDLLQRFRPVGLSEEKLVNRMAAVQWRLDRTIAIEAGIYQNRVAELLNDDDRVKLEYDERTAKYLEMGVELPPFKRLYDPKYLMARAFNEDVQAHCCMGRLARYESSLERSFDRAIRQLKVLQTARVSAAGSPHEDCEPDCETNPEPLRSEPVPAPSPAPEPPVTPPASASSRENGETKPWDDPNYWQDDLSGLQPEPETPPSSNGRTSHHTK